MTEDRKQQLAKLLQEAVGNLEIRKRSKSRPELPLVSNVHDYIILLREGWASHSFDLLSSVMHHKIHIIDETTKSKLLDFIRAELASFIHEDRIQSGLFFLRGGPTAGYSLDNLLEQLIRIALASGIEKAVSSFDKCTENTSGAFQYIILLDGIKVEKEIQFFETMRLVPLPNSTSGFSRYLSDNPYIPCYLSDNPYIPYRPIDLLGKTLLVINASVSPIFFKPGEQNLQVEVTGGDFPNFNIFDFREKILHALSLACNSAVQFDAQWQMVEKHELFNLDPFLDFNSWNTKGERGGNRTVAGETEINKAEDIYRKLIDELDPITKRLQIPIERWIKSKAERAPVDKMIDLGIALEALYLSGTDYNREIRFRFSLYAAWYLGKDTEHKKALFQDFKTIYDLRSRAVHTGELSEKEKKKIAKVLEEEIDADIAKTLDSATADLSSEEKASIKNREAIRKELEANKFEAFMINAQNLCRDSIIKILEDRKFPDWNSLVLGEDNL